MSEIEVCFKLQNCISRYTELYNRITDNFGFPKQEYYQILSKTTGEFLDYNDLSFLKHVFHVRLDITGYGGLNVPAFYGIMNLTPDAILKDVRVTYNSSWRKMWDTLLKKSEAKVMLNSNVSSIEYKDDKISLMVNDSPVEFDFVIIAAPAPKIHHIIKNKTHMQEVTLSKIDQVCYAISYLYKYTPLDDNIPVKDYEGLLIHERNDEWNFQSGYKKYKDTNIEFGFQFPLSITPEKLEKAEGIFVEDLKKHNKKIEILHRTITDTYFPHFNCEAISQGSPWELFKLQGENKMWFVGASCTFDLTYSIINYNRKLLD